MRRGGWPRREPSDVLTAKSNGGYARFDKIFEGRLAEVLGEIGEAIWQRAG
jgi:hypothetical protein